MSGARFAIFLSTAMTVWGLVHAYIFWRLSGVPWISGHVSTRTLVITGTGLWLSYLLARMLDAWGWDAMARPLELASVTWMGVATLLFFALLVVDVVTLGGFVLVKLVPLLRGGAALVALVLSVLAVVQGLRKPVVIDHEIALAGLPASCDGLRMVAVSDLHLGSLLGERWLRSLVQQINGLKPDLVVAVGDVVDGDGRHIEPLVPVLKTVQAPLGVWAVTGNHEFYVGLEKSVKFLEEAGWTVLRDRAVEVRPGLVLAGVDDLTARQQFGEQSRPLEKALVNRPAGATILLSHSPWQAEEAASRGVGLMLSGHTHGGQIWPFHYLVRLRYRLLAGRYEVDGMPVIVCRGTGTWGPRMRLWKPSEMLHITLRASSKVQ
jgi:hypothetical protein